jgi:hypothetical protein
MIFNCCDFEKSEFEEKLSSDNEFKNVFTSSFNEYEGIQVSIFPSHEDRVFVNCTPFQVLEFYDAIFDDLENEEFVEKPLDLINFSFDKEHDHESENVDDF